MTTPIGPSSQYATAKPLFDRVQAASANLSGSPDDMIRLRAYALWEDMYYNRPETFKVFLRGDHTNSDPLYVPSAKKIVEAMNRFLCKNYGFVVPPSAGEDAGLAAKEALLVMHMTNLFKREKMKGKFSNQKRNGLIKGDACWYIVADPKKPEGSRLSIYELDPGNYFPIKDPFNRKRILGFHIVEVVPDPREAEDKTKAVARRQTYLKAGVAFVDARLQYEEVIPGQTGVYTSTSHWEVGKWDDRNMKPTDLVRVTGANVPDVQSFKLPDQITSLPVYHWRNNELSNEIFGLSEISGLETLIAGVNQGLTDEALALLMAGLGLYATDSRPPQNPDGSTGNWTLGPAGVVEVPQGKKFERVSGVPSVQPSLDHISKLQESMQEANGIPDIAAGKVDVAIAESGISLQLQLAPIISAASEKENEILGVMDQMLYDLTTQWFPAYENLDFTGVSIYSIVDDAMPVNRDAKIQEVILLFTSGLITIAHAQAELAKLGYSFKDGDALQVLKDAAALAAAKTGDTNKFEQLKEPESRELSDDAGKLPEGFGGSPSPGEDANLGTPATIPQAGA
ncbi:portal protein [Gordonia phage Suzy]|uniref:Portal protein n=1 Tax=Gordonia phage Suzy TaxID=2201430 RepID=A0A2Z4Q7P0_9CAUD|nr:portal protein [Gordonia phage Suzy]AWY06107.1 portal protein [Gordonia phage Suzy]